MRRRANTQRVIRSRAEPPTTPAISTDDTPLFELVGVSTRELTHTHTHSNQLINRWIV